MSTTLEVGKKLAELCRQKKWMQAVDTLYSPDIVSIEAQPMPQMPQRMEGIKAVRGKTEWWEQNHDVHNCEVSGPWPHGDRFIVTMKIDVTSKSGPMAGKRATFDEACLYTVKNGKIVQEEFFYDMPG
jgi:ketosteroid isomerase-like protein